jgi:hypothetical protein
MMSCITEAASLVEPGLDVLFDYKICLSSGNRYLVEMQARTHLQPTHVPIALTLDYRSLRSSRRSIRNGCQKSQKCCQYVLRKSNSLENRVKRAKERAVKAVERILGMIVWR